MRKNIIYKIVFFILVTCGLAAAVFVRFSRPQTKLDGLHSCQQLQEWNITISYCYGQGADETSACRDLKENGSTYVNDTLNASVILLVRPTDLIEQTSDVLMQEVQVLKVIKAPEESSPAENDNIRIFRIYDGFKESGKKIKFTSAENIMYADKTYYVFLTPSALNDNLSRKEYVFANTLVTCINAENMGQEHAVIGEDFNANRGLTMFCATEKVCDAYKEIIQMIISRLQNNVYD